MLGSWVRAPAGSRFNKRQPKHKLRLFVFLLAHYVQAHLLNKKTNSCRLQDCRYSVGALFGGCEDRGTFIARLRLRYGYPRQLRASPPLRAPAGSRNINDKPKLLGFGFFVWRGDIGVNSYRLAKTKAATTDVAAARYTNKPSTNNYPS